MNYLHAHMYLYLTGALLITCTNKLHAQAAPELMETLIVSGERSSDALFARQITIKTAEDFAAGAGLTFAGFPPAAT